MIRRTARKQIPESIYVLGKNGFTYKVEIRNGINLKIGDVIASKNIIGTGHMFIGVIVIDEKSSIKDSSLMPESDYAFVSVVLSDTGFWLSHDTCKSVVLDNKIREMGCISGFDSRTGRESPKYVVIQKDVLHIQKQMENNIC